MLERSSTGRAAWLAVAGEQEGIIARQQLLACGFTPAQARQRIETGHWLAVLPGVYATFTGPLSEIARVWAAVLYAGPDACASHGTALWLAGALDRPPSIIHLTVPAERRVRPQAGMRIHLSRAYTHRRHPSATPPRTRIEDATLDVSDGETDVERVLGIVLQTLQRRLTTADRLRSALARRTRHRWRALLGEVLSEAEDGVASALELRYAKDVERAHGLPRGQRNTAEAAPRGGRWYRDVRYEEWNTVVELDGLDAHPMDQRFRDLRRDNQAVVHGESVLRYGWRDVAGRPCEAAGQVGTVLHLNEWTGRPHPCGPGCPLS